MNYVQPPARSGQRQSLPVLYSKLMSLWSGYNEVCTVDFLRPEGYTKGLAALCHSFNIIILYTTGPFILSFIHQYLLRHLPIYSAHILQAQCSEHSVVG